MTGAGSRVSERATRDGNELPRVRGGAERQLEDAPGLRVVRLRIRDRRPEGIVTAPAGADDELADAAGGVRAAGGGLWGKALVVVVVAGHPHRPVQINK